MTGTGLAQRFHDYFGRQVAWLEELLGEYENLLAELEQSKELSSERLTELIEEQMRNTSRSDALAAEFRALWNEYQSTRSLDVDDRKELAPSVERARELAGRLSQIHRDAAGRMAEHLARGKASYAELRKGVGMLRKYRPGGPAAGGGYVDRRA